MLALCLVLAAASIAAVTDLLHRRIPNVLVAALAIAGVAVNAAHGIVPTLTSLATIVVVLLLGTIAFSFKLVGGGDIKLIAAAAGALNFPDCIGFILYTVLAGGVLALIFSIARGQLRSTMTNLQSIALPLLAGVKPVRPANSIAMPYALAIAAGAIVVAVADTVAPALRIHL